MSHLKERPHLQKGASKDFDSEKLQLLADIDILLSHEIDPTQLDHIIVLGASMDKRRKRGWALPSIVESDNGFIVGGKTRAIAAQQLVKEGFQGKFLVTGGTQYDGEKAVSRAQVLASVMTNRYAIEQSQVEVIGTAGNGNTLGNVANTIEYFDKYGPMSGAQVGLLTNTWHMGRSLLMFLSNPYFSENCIDLLPVNADEVLANIGNQHMDRWLHSFQNDPKMEERHSMEEQGIQDFLSGRYKPLSQ